MKVKTMLSVFLLLFVLVACLGQETFHFKGKSDNWKVEYVVDVIADDDYQSGTIKMKYIGKGEEPIHVNYKIKGDSGEIDGDLSPIDDVWETLRSNCPSCDIAKKEDEFDVTIEWEESSEIFTLRTGN